MEEALFARTETRNLTRVVPRGPLGTVRFLMSIACASSSRRSSAHEQDPTDSKYATPTRLRVVRAHLPGRMGKRGRRDREVADVRMAEAADVHARDLRRLLSNRSRSTRNATRRVTRRGCMRLTYTLTGRAEN